MNHNALRSWHVTMYKFVTSMVHCGLGMQYCAMHNATIHKTTFFELGHPNKMFHFPSPSTRKVESVGRSDKKKVKK